ncbi:MAG: PilC/PilY family type IV pilus protein [Myxococcota bacterium]|nr:PilC/PilY family type IV pilus protein [Myxococcota bacterium]
MARALATMCVGAALLVAPAVRAQQIDVNPPLSNVLILLDNSGSMERMIDGTLPEDTPANACNCNAATGVCNWSAQPPPNRWGLVQQAFTGSFVNGYNCAAMPRTPGSVFASEYQIDGNNPYDINYYVPFHRSIAKDTTGTTKACVYAPGTLPGAITPHGVGSAGTGAGGFATDFPANAILQRIYGGTTACQFGQQADGALDSEANLLRFGLMTFDQDPSPGLGVTSVAQPTVVSPAFTGMWSYFPGWNSGGTCTYTGNPVNCMTSSLLAVGARNPAAPPWEGRMVPLPAANDIATLNTQNGQIQQVVLATRPYGATPLAGMFTGAQYYYLNDPSGPKTDPFVQGGCRKEYIILLTDGAPNLDMRPACAANGTPNGVCPFPLPETTAATLFNAGSGASSIKTYVIGFAVSSFQDQSTTIYCSNLVANGALAAACSDPVKLAVSGYAPCCQLQQIAIAGGSNNAYFADTPGDLQKALGAIFGDINQNNTTRTTPAYSSVVTNAVSDPNAPKTNQGIYLASFIPAQGQPWSGDIQRQRYVCTYQQANVMTGTKKGFFVAPPTVTTSLGDDFAANLNSNSSPRTVIALQPDVVPSTTTVDASATIRPYVATNVGDHLGKYSATTYAGAAASVISNITASALALPANPCSYYANNGTGLKSLTASQCRTVLLDYTFGQPLSGGPSDFSFVSRVGNAFGDIFHAAPAVVGPPASLISDDSYIGFRSAFASRRQIVFAATNDGLLHAFWADETKLENNELWAMIPPAVLPNLLASYPSSHSFLLDGSPIVKDVVWDRPLSTQKDPANWHTMLVAGFGSSQRGYYAVDVTRADPNGATLPTGAVPTLPPSAGPVFMWQLTKMPATNAALFGARSVTPAIATLFFDPGDGGGARDIGVAILPGGEETGPTSSAGAGNACARVAKATDSAPPSGYVARTGVRCWGKNALAADPVIGRSLSIVRLDTGEIMRVFMRAADAPAGDTLVTATRLTDTPLDSPMTGTPVLFPAEVGADTTKLFIGDDDGTIWRFDLSSTDPSQWKGELFLDLYNQTVDTAATAWSDGQPIVVQPVISLDTAGEVVLNIASGAQETFDTSGTHFVYSVTERVQGSPAKLRAAVNWWLNPATATGAAGERVSGPMTVFDGVLYFATYAAAGSGAQTCNSGAARLWGRDFVRPDDPNTLSKGGLRILQPPQGQPQTNPPPIWVQPSDYDATLVGAVIPGVSIKATPACASLGTSTADSYVAGAQHAPPQDFAAGQYSLFAQIGAKGSGGSNTRTFDSPVPTPLAPTIIDSWAAVLE